MYTNFNYNLNINYNFCKLMSWVQVCNIAKSDLCIKFQMNFSYSFLIKSSKLAAFYNQRVHYSFFEETFYCSLRLLERKKKRNTSILKRPRYYGFFCESDIRNVITNLTVDSGSA